MQSKVGSGGNLSVLCVLHLKPLKISVVILIKDPGISLKEVTSGRDCFKEKGVYFKTSYYKGFKVEVCGEKWT